MESSPGLVRRRIQEMTTSFQTQNSPRNSPKNSPKNQTRKKFQTSLQPAFAKVDSTKMSSTSSLIAPNKRYNSMGAKPFKAMYTATATTTVTTSKSPASNRRFNNPTKINDANDKRSHKFQEMQENNPEMKNKRLLPPSDAKDANVGENEKQRRKTTPTNLFLTAPKPFKSLTNTYESNNHRKPANNISMDCSDTNGYNSAINKNGVSSSTLPSRYQQQNGNGKSFHSEDGPDGYIKEVKPSSPTESSSPTTEPPPILPRRSASSLRSPNKPAVPPKPRNIKSSPSPKKSSPEINGVSHVTNSKCNTNGDTPVKMQVKENIYPTEKTEHGISKDVDTDRFCESPINTSFTKFNQRVQKLDLLKRRQSYSEFEELIEKKRELRERMLAKIALLREEHDVLLNEKKENDNSGKRVLIRLEQMASDKEVDKYRQFLEEIEHITKLTVGLTIRLSRLTKKIESNRAQLSEEVLSQERKKRKRLVEQTEEAEFLHRNTDRRSAQVRKMLSRYLDESDLNDYDAFLSNLIKHITDLKETEQRIQLGEEQLVALNDNLQNSQTSLPPSPPINSH